MAEPSTMTTQINRAIEAHKAWKQRLYQAIETGASEWTPAEVAAEDRCAFGQWLASFPEAERERKYDNVRDLHAQFHREAGRVLGLALDGEAARARAGLGLGSRYDSLTTQLRIALELWRDLNI
ncbi:MAG: CZB domain-containing protein [Hyphomicrobiales bacterium]|nr:CZB domain-containing protein [Hyphomicrobiales bacterium]